MIQMKYSIIAQDIEKENPFVASKLQRKFFSSYRSTCIVTINEKNVVKLQLFERSKEQQSPTQLLIRENKATELIISEGLDWEHLKLAWREETEWILVFQRPLRIYFVLDKYKTIVPIKLEQEIDLVEISCYITSPDLLIYGHSSNSFKNTLYNINLSTLQIKEITSSKDYSPKGRNQCWSFFSDSRLYVAGGLDKNRNQIDSLLWTLNIENGYWFALDLIQESSRLSNRCLSCEFQNGKVLLVAKDQIAVVELYQSQVKAVQGWKDFITLQQLQSVEQVFIWQQWLYIVCSGVLYPKRFRIDKKK